MIPLIKSLTFPLKRLGQSALFLALGLHTGTQALADWPTYRADFSRSGFSPNEIQVPLVESWTFKSTYPPKPAWQGEAKWDGYNKVYDMKARQIFDRAFHCVARDNRVYFGSSSSDQVYCLDADTGETRWTFFTEGPIRLAPTLVDNKILFGSDDGYVYCLDAESGSELWRYRGGPKDYKVPGNGRIISLWPIRTGIAVNEGIAYGAAGMFPSEGVYIFALNLKDGTKLWEQKQSDLPAQGYILASQTKLYVPAGRNNPVIFERLSGKRLRVASGPGGTYCLLTGDSLIFGPGKHGQLGWVDEARNDQLATFDGNHMIVQPNISYLHGDDYLRALDRTRYLKLNEDRRLYQAAQAKLNKEFDSYRKQPETDPAKLADFTRKLGLLGKRIDEATAQLSECTIWNVPCRFPYHLIQAGSNLLVGGQDEFAVYSSSDGNLSFTAKVDGAAYGLAASNGRVIVSTDKGSIHCFTTL